MYRLTKEEKYLINLIRHSYDPSKYTLHQNISYDFDFSSLESLIIKHRLSFHLYDLCKKYHPSFSFVKIEADISKEKRRTDLYAPFATMISEYAKTSDIPLAIIKGIPYSYQIYSRMMRKANDIDILVNESDMYSIDRYVRQLGFINVDSRNGLVYELPCLKNKNHHEFFSYRKRIEDECIYIEIGRFVHFISPSLTHKLLENTIDVHINKKYVSTLGMKEALVQSIGNCYENSNSLNSYVYDSLRISDYFDLANLINKYNINAITIRKILSEYGIDYIGKVIFSNLCELFNADELFLDVLKRLDVHVVEQFPPFLIRCFHYNKRQAFMKIKKDIYSLSNRFFNTLYHADTIITEKSELNHEIGIKRKDSNSLIIVYTLPLNYSLLQNYAIEIFIYNNEYESDNFSTCIMLTINDDKLMYAVCENVKGFDSFLLLINGQIKENYIPVPEVKNINDKAIVELNINCAGYYPGKSTLIALKTSIKKKMNDFVYHDISDSEVNLNIPLYILS